MQVAKLDHVNIQTVRLRETVRFYVDVLELEAFDPPPPLDPGLIQWVRGADGVAIFHISSPGSLEIEGSVGADTGPIHHVALECQDHNAMLARLARLGIGHRANHVAAIDLRQIFVRDPNGILLELNYRQGNHRED